MSNDKQNGERLDPTRMRNQPSLRTSSGRIWLIFGGLFALASLAALGMFYVAGEEHSRSASVVVAVIVVVIYGMMIIARFGITARIPRLRVMAAGMLAMAAVAVIGLVICGMLAAAG